MLDNDQGQKKEQGKGDWNSCRIDGPSDKGENQWGQPCYKPVKSDDITNFITLRKQGT